MHFLKKVQKGAQDKDFRGSIFVLYNIMLLASESPYVYRPSN